MKNASSQNLELKTQNSFTVVSRSVTETRAWGRRLGRLLSGGEIIGLTGELGSGKTCFTRGLAEGVEVDKSAWIRSPTFTLVNEYHGRLAVYHIDLYRIESEAELEELGLRDCFFSEGVSVVEWCERLPASAVEEYLHLRIEYLEEGGRRLTFTPHGGRYENILTRLRVHSSKVQAE
jgi:tRNA threonylcarbamoyladenosine biosynthesis protein TsaE